jgi:hypothetical protein
MAKYRTGIPGHKELGPILNSNAWGDAKAVERGYGSGTRTFPAPADKHAPQRLGDDNNLQGNYYSNNVRNDWRRGNGMKPNFQKGKS